ncbi:hypothetical protein B0H21DRAFT_706795 [Amylocystis lapponica]|nr:hypothetical protein B0H21DRAFT_706795 [Amylocystis lapponica]
MHSFMLHSASKNHLREPRVITNPPVSLKAPFNFTRENPDDYSLVELKTLRALGVDYFPFRPTTERRRQSLHAKMLENEKQRLAGLAKAKEDVGGTSVSHPIAVV